MQKILNHMYESQQTPGFGLNKFSCLGWGFKVNIRTGIRHPNPVRVECINHKIHVQTETVSSLCLSSCQQSLGKTSWYHYQQLDQVLPPQASVPGPALPVREHMELSPASPGCLCCPKIPESGLSMWLYPNCITLLVGERFVCEPVLAGS